MRIRNSTLAACVAAVNLLGLSTLALAAPPAPAPAAPAAAADNCENAFNGNNIKLMGLIYKAGDGIIVGPTGEVCNGSAWSKATAPEVKNIPANTDVYVNTTTIPDEKDQRIAVTKESCGGASVIRSMVTTRPLLDENQASRLAGLSYQPKGWVDGVRGNSRSAEEATPLGAAARFVSATQFANDATCHLKMVSQTQCFAGKCLNVNADSCNAYKKSLNESLIAKGLSPVEDFKQAYSKLDACYAIAEAGSGVAQTAAGPKTKAMIDLWTGGSYKEATPSVDLYNKDLQLIKNSAAINALNKKEMPNLGFKPYKSTDMSDAQANMGQFILGCQLMATINKPAGVNPPAPAAGPGAARAPGK